MQLLLGQAATSTTVFYWTLLFIFLTGIVTTIATKWARDKCLKFFRGYHVTLERAGGKTIWGKLKVFPTGIELEFDHPYVDPKGNKKSSFLIYQPELDTTVRTLLRYHDELTDSRQSDRIQQVHRSFRPGPPRRLWRTVRNFVNTLRDAFNAAIGAAIGQYQRMSPTNSVLASQGGQVTQIGQTLLGRFANAYEPLLEQYIGQAVILDVIDPTDPTKPAVEYTGYLADYSQQFVAVFNVEHVTEKWVELRLPAGDSPAAASESPPDAPPDSPRTEEGMRVSMVGGRVKVQNTRNDPVVIRRLEREGFEAVDMGMTLAPGATLELQARDARGGNLVMEIIRCVDVVAPRKVATIRHAGEWCEPRGFLDAVDLAQLPLIPKTRFPK